MTMEMNAGHFEEISDCWSSEEQPTAYYRTTAARARRLQADATTPRVKQYLDKMIVHCEQLAGKVEQSASRPLDRPRRVDQPRGRMPASLNRAGLDDGAEYWDARTPIIAGSTS
jgi:hypothetical protein